MKIDRENLSGRNRRLLYEWQQIETRLEHKRDITYKVLRSNAAGLPTAYLIDYQIKSICGVDNLEHFGEPGIENPPVFATGYQMRIDLPDGYPSVDAPPTFRFLTHTDQGQPIPIPGIRISAILAILPVVYVSICLIPIAIWHGEWNGWHYICITISIMRYANRRTPRT